jgi:hypothetical protein
VSVFRNLTESLTASRLPECIHETDEKTLSRFSEHWFFNVGSGLANNPISHQSLLVEDLLPTKPQAAGRRYGGRKSARYSCLTGGKLEENPDFSLRRVTFR